MQGTQIFTTINNEVVEARNNAAAAKRTLEAAIRDTSTMPRRLQELEEEEARTSQIYAARMAASEELDNFLSRVQALLRDPEAGDQD